jgi:beta-mannosidase
MKSPYEKYPNVYLISVSGDSFAKDVYLSYDFEEVKFSDNFFDLLPGEEKNMIMYSKEAIDQVNTPMKIISLFDTFGK